MARVSALILALVACNNVVMRHVIPAVGAPDLELSPQVRLTAARLRDVVPAAAAPKRTAADALGDAAPSHRRTAAGDAHERGTLPTTAPIGVGLGLPSVGAPAPLPATTGCTA